MLVKPPSSKSSMDKISIKSVPLLALTSKLYNTKTLNSTYGTSAARKPFVPIGEITSSKQMASFGSLTVQIK
jgi:hypothetical protein